MIMKIMETVPRIIDETENFAVVYKPPRMHCAPLRNNTGNTLLSWYAAAFPPVMILSGKKEGEGGLLHRLDFETQGLVLFAKNQQSLNYLQTAQNDGNFIKEYSAICVKAAAPPPAFPPPPFSISELLLTIANENKAAITSYFRPYGPGRKEVRPVTETRKKEKEIASHRGNFYRTEITAAGEISGGLYRVTARLKFGFRHQIRSHLAWIGCPVLNDPVYGTAANSFLMLRSTALNFPDPANGIHRNYRISQLEIPEDSM